MWDRAGADEYRSDIYADGRWISAVGQDGVPVSRPMYRNALVVDDPSLR